MSNTWTRPKPFVRMTRLRLNLYAGDTVDFTSGGWSVRLEMIGIMAGERADYTFDREPGSTGPGGAVRLVTHGFKVGLEITRITGSLATCYFVCPETTGIVRTGAYREPKGPG